MEEIKHLNATTSLKVCDRVVVTRGIGSSGNWIGHAGTVLAVYDHEPPTIVRVDFDGETECFQPYQLRHLNLIERIGELDAC